MRSPTHTCSGTCSHGDSWLPWRVLLIAAMGEALTDEERVVFNQAHRTCTRTTDARQRIWRVSLGGAEEKPPRWPLWATYMRPAAITATYSPVVKRECCSCVAQDTKVAKLLLDRIEANLTDSEILRQLIKGRTQDGIELTNNISIEVKPASFRKLRGPTYIAVIADELAFWFTDATSPIQTSRCWLQPVLACSPRAAH